MMQLRDPKFRAHIIREGRQVWERMIDTRDFKVRMCDDGLCE